MSTFNIKDSIIQPNISNGSKYFSIYDISYTTNHNKLTNFFPNTFDINTNKSSNNIVFNKVYEPINISNYSKTIRISETTKPIRNNNFNFYTLDFLSQLTNSTYYLAQNISITTFAPNYPVRIYE